MTYWEFIVWAEGRQHVEHEKLRLAAWHATHLMNMWVEKRKKITPDQLIEPAAKGVSRDEAAAHNRSIKDRRTVESLLG